MFTHTLPINVERLACCFKFQSPLPRLYKEELYDNLLCEGNVWSSKLRACSSASKDSQCLFRLSTEWLHCLCLVSGAY